jgi:predicted phosphodiesterase
MRRILILSDVHYPVPSIETVKSIIAKESFDKLIFLGDVIDTTYSSMDFASLWKEFFNNVFSIVPLSKIVVLYGDNDISITVKGTASKVANYELEIAKAIGIPALKTYRLGNMFFFHGNMETSHLVEKIGYYAVKTANRLGATNIIPKQLALTIESKYKTEKMYNFFGHIHLLQKYDDIKAVFCGTLNSQNIIYQNSIGYVVIETNDNYEIESMDKIELKQI